MHWEGTGREWLQQGKQSHPSDTAGESMTQGTPQVWSFSSLTPAMTLNQQGLLVSKTLVNDADVERGLKCRHDPKGKMHITVWQNAFSSWNLATLFPFTVSI